MYTRKQRDVYVRSLLADIITEGLEEAECRGRITRKEVQFWYNRLGTQLFLPDLLPSKLPNVPDPEELKQQIKDRLASPLYNNVIVFPDSSTPKVNVSTLCATFAGKLKRTKTDA